jgi:hypothetical protein
MLEPQVFIYYYCWVDASNYEGIEFDKEGVPKCVFAGTGMNRGNPKDAPYWEEALEAFMEHTYLGYGG